LKCRHSPRFLLACLTLALLAAFGVGAGTSEASRKVAPAPGSGAPFTPQTPQTFVLTDFGAVADGQTDAGPALQAALDALKQAGGGTLFVPQGRYAIVTPVVADFAGLDAAVVIHGVESDTAIAPPTSDGDALTRGLDLVSEFAPRTDGEIAINIGNLRSLLIHDVGFIGTPGVYTDALITLSIYSTDEAVIRHCEFYGLASLLPGGAIVQNWESNLSIQQTAFLGSTANSGLYTPVVQNFLWKGITVEDTIFADYGQRPELYAKTSYGSPLSWINVGHAAPLTADSPRREVVLRKVFLDEGSWQGVTVQPTRYDPWSPGIDLFYATGLRVNVPNFQTTAHYLTGVRSVLVEDSFYGWSHRADSAIDINGADHAILEKVRTAAAATRLRADASTQRLTVIDSVYEDLASAAVQTVLLNTLAGNEDHVFYVRTQFQTALGRAPDPAAHFYWSDLLLRCGADAACVLARRASLAAYLASVPAPVFPITGRVTGEGGEPLGGVELALSGSQAVTVVTGADGLYSLGPIPTSGDYTVTASKRHHTFAQPSQAVSTPAGARVMDFTATFNQHAIGGRLLDERGRAIQGATLTLSGARDASTTSDAAGDYSFHGLHAGGNYTVTAASERHTFQTPSQTFDDLDGDKSAPFNGTSLFHTVGGQVMNTSSAPVAGLEVTLSGSQTRAVMTDAGGYFQFVDLPRGGSYTVAPGKLLGSTFHPAPKDFEALAEDQNFLIIAYPTEYRIKGSITSGGVQLQGVTVTLSGSRSDTATTDAAGAYSFSVPIHGDFTVTPSKTSYTFDRASATFNGVTADQTADFTAALGHYMISGRVTRPGGQGMAGVTMELSGAQVGTATTDADGAYSFTVSSEGTYTVTPSRTHYTFAPQSLSFTDPRADHTADFAATLNRHAISGRVTDAANQGLSGVLVALSGGQTAQATTDANGNYAFTSLPAGAGYAVTPARAHYLFSPAAQSFDDLDSDRSANFVARLVTYHIGGRVTEKGSGLAGVTVGLAGSHPLLGPSKAETVTAFDGSYALEVAAGGDYTVTPSKRGYTFERESVTFAALGGDGAADFAATLRTLIEFSVEVHSVGESDGMLVVNVTRDGDTSTSATVVYEALGDTAQRGLDFVASIGQLTFAPGETSKSFTLFITDDSFVESPERLTLTLTPNEGTYLGERAAATVTIDDNDTSPAASNPADDTAFFVRQHYRDFLNREPDAEGLEFWTSGIMRCGTDLRCREAKRVDTSAAFFLSIEFQETGYLVHRLYRASFGRVPERVHEFMLDARVIADGVVVGREGWAERLAANKRAFLEAWAERPYFRESFGGFDDSRFVEALFENMDMTPTAAEREELLADLRAGRPRWEVLAKAVDNGRFVKQEFNRAFVLMQYFGYLRRDPNDAPDGNFDGFDFWLRKLVEAGGDYEKAEMVKAFINSAEYRRRFGN